MPHSRILGVLIVGILLMGLIAFLASVAPAPAGVIVIAGAVFGRAVLRSLMERE